MFTSVADSKKFSGLRPENFFSELFFLRAPILVSGLAGFTNLAYIRSGLGNFFEPSARKFFLELFFLGAPILVSGSAGFTNLVYIRSGLETIFGPSHENFFLGTFFSCGTDPGFTVRLVSPFAWFTSEVASKKFSGLRPELFF